MVGVIINHFDSHKKPKYFTECCITCNKAE